MGSDQALRNAATAQTRSGGLSEHEIEELADRLWERLERRFETIGWNTSTHGSRAEILADNQWVREWRTSAARAKTVAVGAGVMAFVSGALVLIWQAFKQLVTRAG